MPDTWTDGESRAARRLVDDVLSGVTPLDFEVRLWDGEHLPTSDGSSGRFVLVVRSPAALVLLFGDGGSSGYGEAYVRGLLDVEGPLGDAIKRCEHLTRTRIPPLKRLRFLLSLLRLRRPKARVDARFAGATPPVAAHHDATGRSVNYHYDHPLEFWRPWLDRSLSYSCAYFADRDGGLDEAQEAKLEYVCRKLRVRPGMRLFDMGCGWGALMIHAAVRHGAVVVGATFSPRQAEVVRARVAAAGVADRCRVVVGDFFDVPRDESFERIASIGSAEHVPEDRFIAYFRRAAELLRPGGQMLHHAITRDPSIPERPGGSFIDRYVFPAHFLASISGTVAAAEAAGFEVRDVESLREHYELTLSRWLERLESARAEVERASDPFSWRVFRLYLAGAAHEFAVGRVGLHQTLLVKPDRGASGLPLRRGDWYATGATEVARR